MATFQIPQLPDVSDDAGDRVIVVQSDDELGLVPGYIRSVNGQTGPEITIQMGLGPAGPPGEDGLQGVIGPAGTDGVDGADGLGVPAGGTTSQVLAKATDADNDTAWVDSGVVPGAWTAVVFENGWSNYGSSFQSVEYRKHGDMVQVRGAMKGGDPLVNVFTLPVGFRPPTKVVFNFYAGPAHSGLFVIDTNGLTQASVSDGGNLALVTTDYSFSLTA